MFGNYYSGKKVIVTGHTGFKGSWLAAWLKSLGAEVIGISMHHVSKPSHFEILKLDIESHSIDVRDSEKIAAILKNSNADAVFHLAAQPLVRDSYERPIYTLETNVIGTANVLNACRDLDRLKAAVIVTTDKCYENREWIWGYRENDPMGGHDPYSASKGCAELVVSCFRNSYFNLSKFGKRHNTLVTSARSGNVIGGGDWAKDRLIPDIIRAIEKNETVKIRSPNAARPWQHVLECLSGYLCLGEKLLQGEKKFAEAWNFAPADDGIATVLDVVKKMQSKWTKLQYEVQVSDKQPHEANLLKLDCSKANSILRWKNVWELDKTVDETTSWYRDFYENDNISTFDNIENYYKDAKKLSIDWASK